MCTFRAWAALALFGAVVGWRLVSVAGAEAGFTENLYVQVTTDGAFPLFAINGRVQQWLWSGPGEHCPAGRSVDFTAVTVDCDAVESFDAAAEKTSLSFANAYFVWRLKSSDPLVGEKIRALESKPYSRRIVGYCLADLTDEVALRIRRLLAGKEMRKLMGCRLGRADGVGLASVDRLVRAACIDFVSVGTEVPDDWIRSIQTRGVVPVLESFDWSRSLVRGLPLCADPAIFRDVDLVTRARCAKCAGDWMIRRGAVTPMRVTDDGEGGRIETNGKILAYVPTSPGFKRIRLPDGIKGAVDVFTARNLSMVDDGLLLDVADLSPRLIYLVDGRDDWDFAGAALEESKGDHAVCGLPVETHPIAPVAFLTNANGRAFVDFGKAAFGWLELLPPPGFTGGVCSAMVGESVWPGHVVNCWPAGSIRRAWCDGIRLPASDGPLRIPFDADRRNTRYSKQIPPIKIPQQYGTIMPFRYVEFFDEPFPIGPGNVRMVAMNYPMDMTASSFRSSSPELDEVYDFCKYSVYATSFAGLYVDGDRERVPYEADAYINQLGHLAIDANGKMARATLAYLLEHPTGPTEWRQHAIKMAWTDWMSGGDHKVLALFYPHLKDHGLFADRVRADGLLASPPDRLVFDYTDIIDWPPANRDGFEFRPANAVANAFYFRNLTEMAEMAEALEKHAEAAEYRSMALRVRTAYREKFLDRRTGLFVDGEGSSHSSLHANAFAVVFGLAEELEMPRVADYLESRGMVCSVYVAQYLLEALFRAGRSAAAVRLMTARGKNSWLGMKEQGATMTMEAWNLEDKHNLDWNHAWGAAPLNVIPRFVLGVRQLEPGCAKILVHPQLGGLHSVTGKVPTVRGPVSVEVVRDRLTVTLPVPATIVWREKIHEVGPGRHVFDE